MVNRTSTTLIAIEGSDCSFKETNSKALKDLLKSRGFSVELIDFPQYDSQSSYFVQQWLRNEKYRQDKFDIQTGFRVATFYALDRYDTYINKIKDLMGQVDVIIFDRYVMSNYYQCARIYDIEKSFYQNTDSNYLQKLIYDFEYYTLGLPIEDMTIYLNMPYDIGKEIRSTKLNKDLNEVDEKLQNQIWQYYSHIKEFKHRTPVVFNINIGEVSKEIDFVKCALGNEEEINKSKKAVFDLIVDTTYNKIINTINKRHCPKFNLSEGVF